MTAYSDKKAILAHYDTETGIGNVYKLLADWPNVIKAILLGWERALNHPAVLRYGFDYTGRNFEVSLRKPVYELFSLLSPRTRRVLDAGCGVGGATFLLAQKFPGTEFIGVSLSPGQIATAQKRAEKKDLTNVRYIVANYLHLPFPDDYFDGIMASETFCHVEDEDKGPLFKELYRVLKKQGKVAIFDAYLADRPVSQMYMPKLHAKVFRGWMLPDKLSTASFFLKEAQKKGFRVVVNDDVTSRVMGCSEEVVRRYNRLAFLIPVIKMASWMRKKGIRLPIISQMGFDQSQVLDFGETARLQYDMFKYRDCEYRKIVFEKK